MMIQSLNVYACVCVCERIRITYSLSPTKNIPAYNIVSESDCPPFIDSIGNFVLKTWRKTLSLSILNEPKWQQANKSG